MIEVEGLTLQYPNGKGIRDVSFQVKEGQVLGYLGPNGAGKTTIIRCLLGYSKADRGSCAIRGLDCRRQAPAIQRFLGYLPGEIAFLDGMTGRQFLAFLSRMRGTKGHARQQELAEMFEIDLSGKIKRYSKGMKQKVGIIAAFMHDPEVIILDEPTSGLDPLMQNVFIDLLLEEKARGATVLLSSHLFEEVERTCDRIAILRAGKLAAVETAGTLRRGKVLRFSFASVDDAGAFAARVPGARRDRERVDVTLTEPGELSALLGLAAAYPVADLEARNQSLEELFLHFYGGDK